MANEVKLEVYTFCVRENQKKKDQEKVFFPLAELSDGTDFIDFFQKYLKYIETDLEKNEQQQKAIRLKEKSLKIASKKRMISGVFESGAYGYESTILSLRDKKKVIKKERDDIEILPFYFLIHVPEDKDIGILILQRFGINGITTVFKQSFGKFFNAEYRDVVLEILPFVSKELASVFIEGGGIKEIILRKYNLPPDKAEKLGLKQYTKKILSVELRVKAKRHETFPGLNNGIKKFIKDPNARFFDFKELRDIGFDGTHKISVVSRLEGKERTIDLSDTGQIRPYYDIDSEVQKEISSHPKFDSIDQLAKSLLDDFLKEI